MRPVDGFFEYEVRAGTVVRAEPFPEARTPAYKLWIDLGAAGVRASSARITELYDREGLVGTQVLCVTNFPSRRIGPFTSEVLVLGIETSGGVVLLRPDREVPNGGRVS